MVLNHHQILVTLQGRFLEWVGHWNRWPLRFFLTQKFCAAFWLPSTPWQTSDLLPLTEGLWGCAAECKQLLEQIERTDFLMVIGSLDISAHFWPHVLEVSVFVWGEKEGFFRYKFFCSFINWHWVDNLQFLPHLQIPTMQWQGIQRFG